MNILEALDTTPELPIKQKRMPRLDPRVIFREHIEEGRPIILAQRRGGTQVGRFEPAEWHAVQLFDGKRTYEQIATILHSEGYSWSEENIREFAAVLSDSELFYKPPGEENVTASGKRIHEHRRTWKAKFGDLSDVQIASFDPDALLNWLYPRLKFVYTTWFTLATLLGFVVMAFLWISRWSELWSDTWQFFGFRNKGTADLIEFWMLFGLMVFWHEFAHGLTCKHFGGEVHKIGFMLMYLMPTFFCDASEVWIYGSKWARIATVLAGVWADLMICVLATVVWWTTPAGSAQHEFAYKIMLLTGVAISLMQMNPLAKLDGYYIFCELIGVANLKERSTAYVSSWLRKSLCGLPVEVEFVARRRRGLYLVYSLLSGLYTYLLLFVVVSFSYNVARSYSPEWAFLLAAAIGFFIFKSRMVNAMKLLRTVYLDKRERWKALTFTRTLPVTLGLALLVFAPVWRETISGRFVLEPAERAIIRASVPGTVSGVFASEGQPVRAHQPLLRLSNVNLQSSAAEAAARVRVATAKATQSQLTYGQYGPAEREKQAMLAHSSNLQDQVARLSIDSPISGIVITPRLQDLLGSYVQAGQEIVEVADLSNMHARVFVPEFAVHDLREGAAVRLHLDGSFSELDGYLVSLSPANSSVESGLVSKSPYTGVRVPGYYVAMVKLNDNIVQRQGMVGTAKIYSRHRSAAGFAWEFVGEMIARRMW